MSNQHRWSPVQAVAMSLVTSVVGTFGCAVATDAPAKAERETEVEEQTNGLPAASGRAEREEVAGAVPRAASPAKPQTLRSASWRGLKIDYTVKDGLAFAGGDMVLGRVNEAGDLVPPDPKLGIKIEDRSPKLTTDDAPNSQIGLGSEAPDQQGWLWAWPPRSGGMGGCQVFYDIDFTIYDEELELDAVNKAVAWFNSYTGCRWDQITGGDGNQHVRFIHHEIAGQAGHSDVGRDCYWSQGAFCFNQDISLNCSSPDGLFGRDCQAVAKHEMFHALGFMHEHQRQERDSYIDVGWGPNTDVPNYLIIPFSSSVGNWGGNGYDINSLMHYRTACTFLPLGLVWGTWECSGSPLRPKGIYPGDPVWLPSDWTRTVGGLDASGSDLNALRAMYPVPPNPPAPPPPCGPTICQHAPDSPCCDN